MPIYLSCASNVFKFIYTTYMHYMYRVYKISTPQEHSPARPNLVYTIQLYTATFQKKNDYKRAMTKESYRIFILLQQYSNNNIKQEQNRITNTQQFTAHCRPVKMSAFWICFK